MYDENEQLKGQLQKHQESYRSLQATAESMKEQLQATTERLKQKEAEHAQEVRDILLGKKK